MRIFTFTIALFLALGLVGQVGAAGFFGAKLPSVPEKVKKAQAQEVEEVVEEVIVEEEEDGPREFIDPREIQGEIRQTNDQLREIKRVLGSAKRTKMTKEVGELTELQQKVLQFQKQLKALKPDSEDARDVLDEYRESEIWDTFNDIRRRVDLPKELSDIKKSLTRVEKLLKQKQLQKSFAALGGDIERLKEVAGTMRAAYDGAMQAMANADTEAVDEALMDIREGGHPGELEGMLHGMRDFSNRARAIRDQEILEAIKSIVAPIIQALNEGDVREARMTAEEIGPQIEKLMQKAMRIKKKGKERKDFLKRIEELERLISEKLATQGQKNEEEEEGAPAE